MGRLLKGKTLIMKYPSQDEIAWQFDTANFRVLCHVEPEDMDPADSFQFEEDIEMIRAGRVAWFCAFVSVWYGDAESNLVYLSHDCLGGCAYDSTQEFVSGHRDADPLNRNSSVMRAARGESVAICHYFPGMVSGAVSDARKELARLRAAPAPRAAGMSPKPRRRPEP